MSEERDASTGREGSSRTQIHYSLPRQYRARAQNSHDRVTLQLLTDPWSVWCWGFEPVRRAIQLRYPTIQFEFLVGGMFPKVPAPDELPFDVDRFFGQVQRNTGMPIATRGIKSDRPESTYPSCIHWQAGRIAAPEKADAYLRALREAAYLDALNVSRSHVAADVAHRVGIPTQKFQAALASGQAEQEFHRQLEQLQRVGLSAYPTLVYSFEGQTTRVEGFLPLPVVLSLAESLSGRYHPPVPDPPLEQIIPPGERLATREVAEVLGVSLERAFERLREAEDGGLYQRHRFRTGDAWSRVP